MCKLSTDRVLPDLLHFVSGSIMVYMDHCIMPVYHISLQNYCITHPNLGDEVRYFIKYKVQYLSVTRTGDLNQKNFTDHKLLDSLMYSFKVIFPQTNK